MNGSLLVMQGDTQDNWKVRTDRTLVARFLRSAA